MKKYYEAAEIRIVTFDNSEVIVASSDAPFVPDYTRDNDETEILRPVG